MQRVGSKTSPNVCPEIYSGLAKHKLNIIRDMVTFREYRHILCRSKKQGSPVGAEEPISF